MVAHVVEDEVVSRPTSGEVFLGVVDDVVGPDRADHLHVLRAADAGHLGTERLGDLHGVRADTTGCPIDQDLLSGLDLAVVAKKLEGGSRGYADSCGLLEAESGRLRHEVVLCRNRVLGEGTRAPAENVVTSPKLRHSLPDRLDCPRDVRPRNAVLRLAQSGRHPHEVRRARHDDHVTDVDGRCTDADQDLAVADLGSVDVPALKDVGRAVPVLNDCLHRGLLLLYGVKPTA